MIRANELRIKNLVQFPFTGIEQVGDIKRVEQDSGENDEYYISSINDRFPRHFSLINPIPLTKEWLLKLGYKKGYKENYFFNAGHTIWICNDLFLCDKNGVILKYVHQLQNLYFLLTGKEIEVTL